MDASLGSASAIVGKYYSENLINNEQKIIYEILLEDDEWILANNI